MEDRVGAAWLSSAMIRSDRLGRILERYNSPQNALRVYMDKDDCAIFKELNPTEKNTLKKNACNASLKRWETLIEKYGIDVITSQNPEYPQRLLNMEDPPHILFYQGNMRCLSGRNVAMIGSRRATMKGLRASEKIASDLSCAGVGIVSGLAYGVDASAHKGCLKGKTATVAVLGCGLDQNYPAENQTLKEEILHKSGLILSEYAPGEKPLGWHFPVRNRIISGLSEAVILIEARIRSGSMSTIQHALDQGKEIFVYPGEPGAASCEGNHQLIREGARYFTEANDILEDLGWLDNPDMELQNNGCPDGTEGISTVQRTILNVIGDNQLGFDEICIQTGLTAPELSTNLTFLQLMNLIIALPGKQYARKK